MPAPRGRPRRPKTETYANAAGLYPAVSSGALVAHGRRRFRYNIGCGSCSPSPAAAPNPEVITDKGTPFADLLVPILGAPVTAGAIGEAVEAHYRELTASETGASIPWERWKAGNANL